MGRRRRLSASVLILVVAAALCGCEKPRTGPDLSTPKAAAITFADALDRGDAQTARLASSGGGMELELVDAMAQCNAGLKQLATVAHAKFGDEADHVAPLSAPRSMAANLADADVDQNAEQATVRSRDRKTVVPMTFVDGVWKVDIGILIKGKDITGIVPQFRATGAATRKVADDIQSGKCTTVTDAVNELGVSVVSAVPDLLRKEIASTVPSAPQAEQ